MSASPAYAPPPSYHETTAGGASTSQCGLPSTIWMSIFLSLIDPRLSKEKQAIGRSELHTSVRFICRDFYLASMHLLRSHYLAAYTRQIRPPYTSDPYPSTDDWTSTPRRESHVLDLFIAISTRAEMEMWESELLMTNEGIEDLFAHHQPRARLEDLVLDAGGRKGRIHSVNREKWSGIAAEDVHVELRFKSAAIKMKTSASSNALKTILEVPRGREESLETTARHLIDSLIQLRISRADTPRGRVYQIIY